MYKNNEQKTVIIKLPNGSDEILADMAYKAAKETRTLEV